MIDNLTILNASCCQVYPQWFASHFVHQSNKEPAKVESIFIIDMMFTAMQSHCKLSGGERKKKYNEHHKEIKEALDILSDPAYFLPFIANLTIAVQLYNNKHKEPMLIFGATSEMYRAFQCKCEDWSQDTVGSSFLSIAASRDFAARKISPPHELDHCVRRTNHLYLSPRSRSRHPH
jgi:hypothetical protein